MKMNTWYDISPEISESLAVWPGDQPFRQTITMDMKKGDHLGLSFVQSTGHLGAHTDAPNHYHAEGIDIAQRSLHYYLGPCQVIHVQVPRGDRIAVTDLEPTKIEAPRVLLKTGSYPNPKVFNEDFNSFSPELVKWLHGQAVMLVGIDTPSVDPFSCKELLSHKMIHSLDMAILEGIVLDEVPPGTYQLMALPLKIKGADASPVRAILLPAGATELPDL